MPELSAEANPELTNQLIAEALADSPPESASADAPPQVDDAPELTLRLPAGHIDALGIVHTEAEVRELTGLDEEFIAKASSSPVRLMTAILQRGVVRVGDQESSQSLLDNLLIGDRDALLVGIRRVTYGNDIELAVTCPHCDAEQDLTIHLDVDVPVTKLDDPEARTFTVNLRRGRKAVVSLPSGATQRAIDDASEKTSAERNTEILARCVTAFIDADGDDSPVLSPRQVQALGLADRETILKELQDRRVGPQLGEVALACGKCEKDIDLPLTLADLFRL